jgi:hypothetical protein
MARSDTAPLACSSRMAGSMLLARSRERS